MLGDDDFDIFFDTDDFAELFTLKLAGVAVGDPVAGLFDESVEVVSPYNVEEVVLRPAVTFPSSGVVGIDKKHTITRNSTGTEYRVYGDPRPDGAGMTRFFLVS